MLFSTLLLPAHWDLSLSVSCATVLSLHALLLAAGLQVTSPIPPRVQIDFDAIMADSPQEFAKITHSWMKVSS